MADAVRDQWITLAEAQRRAAIGRAALLALIGRGRLSVRRVPGSKPRVRADEIAALVELSTREAQPCA